MQKYSWKISNLKMKNILNRIYIINKIEDKYHIKNTRTGEFSYVQALNFVGEDIKY